MLTHYTFCFACRSYVHVHTYVHSCFQNIIVCGIYVVVISQYKNNVVVITLYRGGAKFECNNNDISRVYGIQLTYVSFTVKIGNYVITSCLLNKRVGVNNYYCSVN